MLTLLLVALLLCYVDRVLISIAGIEMQRELGWSDTDKGLVFSSFFVGYLCMQVMGGILANRYGGRNVFLLAVFAWSVTTVLTPAAAYAGFSVLIMARFLLGFGEGAAYPSAYNLINAWMPLRETSRSVSMMGAASGVGTVFALLVVGKMIESWGWPSVFYLFGGLGLIWCGFWWGRIPTVPITTDPQSEKKATRARSKIPWIAILTSRGVVPVYTTAVAYGVLSFTLASWLPSYFVDTFGLGITAAGLYSILPWIALAITAVWAGVVTDRMIVRGRNRLLVRKTMVSVGLSLAAAGSLLLILVSDPLLAAMCAAVSFAGIGISTPGYIPIPAELFPRHGDILYGVMAAVGSVSAVVVVTLTGALLDATGSYDQLFVLLAVLCVIAIGIFLVLGSVTPVLAEDRGSTR